MQQGRRGALFIVGAALLWSTGGVGIKGVADAPLKITFYRSLFAAITLALLFRRRLLVRSWRSTPAFLIAIASYGGCLTSFVIATRWTTAANAIFLQYAGVVWVLILSPFVLREPLRRRDGIAIGIALAGMALFFVGKLEAHGMAGNGMALVSSVFFATLILALRRDHGSGDVAVTWGNIVLATLLFPFIAHDLALTPGSLVILAFLGIFQIALAYVLFVRGLRDVTATQASLTGMLEPVANPIWVFLFLGERPGPMAVVGGIIVLAAVGWHTLTSSTVPLPELQPPD